MVVSTLKKGYKTTDLGVIPEDWSIKKFEDVVEAFWVGQTPTRRRPEYFKGDIPWITSGELEYNKIIDTKEKITKEAAKSANLKLVPKETFLMAISGLEAEKTCGSCAITGIDSTTNQSVMALLPKKAVLLTNYLYYFYEAYGKRLALQYCQGTKQQDYSVSIVRTLPIILPPKLHEQAAIAEVLSDADMLIDSLTSLIEKKRLIKQAAMQTLLTGKKRIFGYGNDFQQKKLREIATIYRGASPRPIENPKWFDDSSSVGWVRISDVTKSSKYLLNTTQRLSKEGIKNSRFVAPNKLITSICATVGRPIITKMKVCIHDGFVVFENLQAEAEYLYYVLSYIEDDWSRQGQTGSQMNLNTTIIGNATISLPETKEEQKSIAKVLSAMDLEIEALEQERDKCKLLKAGLMQQLLTGRIRLKWIS
jgi:type I restriction enzyme S subunit